VVVPGWHPRFAARRNFVFWRDFQKAPRSQTKIMSKEEAAAVRNQFARGATRKN
jgi:hypothetical protein